MNNYTIYCTPEQTKKALELGAPIKHSSICREGYDIIGYNKDYVSQMYGIIPTAEQLIGWLEEQGITLDIHTYFCVDNKSRHYQYTVTDFERVFNGEHNSRKKIILAAIDTAL